MTSVIVPFQDISCQESFFGFLRLALRPFDRRGDDLLNISQVSLQNKSTYPLLSPKFSGYVDISFTFLHYTPVYIPAICLLADNGFPSLTFQTLQSPGILYVHAYYNL